jgi:hypothetical protein
VSFGVEAALSSRRAAWSAEKVTFDIPIVSGEKQPGKQPLSLRSSSALDSADSVADSEINPARSVQGCRRVFATLFTALNSHITLFPSGLRP